MLEFEQPDVGSLVQVASTANLLIDFEVDALNNSELMYDDLVDVVNRHMQAHRLVFAPAAMYGQSRPWDLFKAGKVARRATELFRIRNANYVAPHQFTIRKLAVMNKHVVHPTTQTNFLFIGEPF